jgi:hypothetical protein
MSQLRWKVYRFDETAICQDFDTDLWKRGDPLARRRHDDEADENDPAIMATAFTAKMAERKAE